MDKDETIDRLLRRTAGAGGNHRPADGCLDAETLAAWADGSLLEPQRSAVEAHAADCDRCLAVLAAMAKTSPPPSAALPSWWFPIRWLVPLATAAVAISAWAVLHEPPVTAPAEPRGTAKTQESPREPPADRDQGTDETQKKALEDSRKARAAERDARLERESRDALAKRETAPEASARAKNQPQFRRSSEPPAASKPAASPPARPAPSSQPSARTDAIGDRRQFEAAAQVAPATILSPDPSVRWRLNGASVERSIDGGASWTSQPTATTEQLRAGFAPAPTVCWIVGRNGLVLLTTDGSTWRRLAAPAAVDLIGVTAVDTTTATVTTADGRTYRTTDTGRTWTLQENLATPF